MVRDQDSLRQLEMEVQLLQLWAQDPDESSTTEDVFGPFERWLFPLGSHQLLLHPVLKEWFYFDRLHDTWERTHYGLGEVLFTVRGKVLGAVKRQDSGEAITCSACGYRNEPELVFCIQCGTRLT